MLITEISFTIFFVFAILWMIHLQLGLRRIDWMLRVFHPYWRRALDKCEPGSDDYEEKYAIAREFGKHKEVVDAADKMIDRGNYIEGYQKWKQAVAEAELIFIKVV
jgi:hypothetical protein